MALTQEQMQQVMILQVKFWWQLSRNAWLIDGICRCFQRVVFLCQLFGITDRLTRWEREVEGSVGIKASHWPFPGHSISFCSVCCPVVFVSFPGHVL